MYIKSRDDLKLIDKNIKKLIIHHSYNGDIIELENYEIEVLDLLNYNLNIIKTFPKSLKEVIFNYNYNYPLDNLPNNLEILNLKNSNFNYTVDNLPNNLVVLNLGNNFNNNVNFLPSSLRILTLGISFNKSIDNLPMNLVKLKIEGRFDLSIDNLPNNLKYLVFNNNYNLDINILPDLEYLEIGHSFNKNINYLPSMLKVLIINSNIPKSSIIINNSIMSKLVNLVSLEIHYDINIDYDILKLLKSLKYLKINNIKEDITDKLIKLDNIRYLVLSFMLNIKINKINDNVEFLKLLGNFNNEIEKNILPKNLKYLYLGFSYNKPLINLPNGLKYLFVENYLDIINIPESVIGLHITHLNTTKLTLPNNLIFLDIYILNFDYNYNNDNVIMPNLPESLRYLSISSKIDILKNYNINSLDKNLKYLCINHKIIKNLNNFNNIYNYNNILKELNLDEYFINSYLWFI
jgi:hypothetical protein